MTPDELRERLESAGLARYANSLVGLARPSVRLRATPTDDADLELGASKLGGEPDLTPSFRWPENKSRPLSFIAQVSLSAVSSAVADDRVPTSGLLSFFYDSEEQPWGFDPADRGSWLVVYTAAPEVLERKEYHPRVPAESRFTPCRLTPTCEMTYVPWESADSGALRLSQDELHRYAELFPDEDRSPVHRFLGHPDPMQADMQLECQLVTNGINVGTQGRHGDPRVEVLSAGATDWRLLLQIDTEDAAGMMWGDAGRIYYWIRDQDLAKAAWDETWLVLQC